MQISDIPHVFSKRKLKVILQHYNIEYIGYLVSGGGPRFYSFCNTQDWSYTFTEDTTGCKCDDCIGNLPGNNQFPHMPYPLGMSYSAMWKKIKNGNVIPYSFIDIWEQKRNGRNNKASKASL